MDDSDAQPSNAASPMVVTLLGMVTEIRPLHKEKAELLILVTLLGMVIEVRAVQNWKANSPTLVTLLGILTEIRLVQKECIKY